MIAIIECLFERPFKVHVLESNDMLHAERIAEQKRETFGGDVFNYDVRVIACKMIQ